MVDALCWNKSLLWRPVFAIDLWEQRRKLNFRSAALIHLSRGRREPLEQPDVHFVYRAFICNKGPALWELDTETAFVQGRGYF